MDEGKTDQSKPEDTGEGAAPDVRDAQVPAADPDAPVLLLHKPRARRKNRPEKRAAPDGTNGSVGHGDTGGTSPAPLVRRSWSAAILLILSLCYLVAEIEFNMSLLDIAGSVRSDPAKMEDLQVFGRSVSACGCFLLILGLFAPSAFHISAGRMRRLYYGIGLVCLLPFLLIVWSALSIGGGLPIEPTTKDIVLALLPPLGIAYGSALGRGRNVFVNVVSLFMMVWPAMFLGQKLVIEQALIEKTSWEQRVNARYVLMLRSILEDCTINLDDLALCDAENEQDSVKSARIILGSMWMLSPEGIRRDMEENKDTLVQSVAARGMWFSPRQQYDQYVSKVSDEHSRFKQGIIDRFYAPYKKASDDYFKAVSDETLQAQGAKASAEIEKEIDRGWQQYQQGVREYKQQLSASGMHMLQRIAPYKERLRDFCATRNCPPLLKGKERSIVAEAASDAERQFVQRSGGYTPDIETRAEFLAAYPTQVRLHDRVQMYISENLPHAGFVLPANWRYEKESFERAVGLLIRQEANRQWREKAPAGMPPGLTQDEFFAASGLPPIPQMGDLLMAPEDFFNRMIMPKYREILDKMLGDIEKEKTLYANGEPLAEKGKDYARAVYIPAVALIISLMVVILTMFRWWNALVKSALASLMRRHKLPAMMRMPVQAGMAAVFIAGIVFVPRFMPNPYAGATYERYRDEAVRRAPVVARALDWAIHTQPAVYRLGSPVRSVLDRLHGKNDKAAATGKADKKSG